MFYDVALTCFATFDVFHFSCWNHSCEMLEKSKSHTSFAAKTQCKFISDSTMFAIVLFHSADQTNRKINAGKINSTSIYSL